MNLLLFQRFKDGPLALFLVRPTRFSATSCPAGQGTSILWADMPAPLCTNCGHLAARNPPCMIQFFHACQPVGNQDDRAPARNRVQGQQEFLLGPGIQPGARFIQDQDRRA